jgi:fermentation-respiration switch protein FrsA (DUF1100 family)
MPERAHSTDPAKRRGPGHLAWRIIRIALLSYLGFLLLLKIFENRLVYFPSPWTDDHNFDMPDYMSDVTLQVDGGPTLHGWHLAHPRPRAHVLFFHGNAGNLAGRQYMLENLHDAANLDLFAIDYRGYGKSSGRPTEAGVIEDARLARRTYAAMAGIPESEIVLMGRSLGAGVAVALASHDGARALVLQSTFTSLPDVAALQYPWLPVRLLMKNRFDSLAHISRFTGPLLYSHSEGDTTLDFSLGERLFAAANEPKQFFRFSGRDHNDPQPREYVRVLASFLDSLP